MYERTKKILEKLSLMFNRNFNGEQFNKMVKEWDAHLQILSGQQIETAFHLVILSGASFMPSLPQFVFLAHGFRPAEEAFYEAKNADSIDKLNSLIRGTIRMVGTDIWKRGTQMEVFCAFKAAYHFCCAEVVAGRIIEQGK